MTTLESFQLDAAPSKPTNANQDNDIWPVQVERRFVKTGTGMQKLLVTRSTSLWFVLTLKIVNTEYCEAFAFGCSYFLLKLVP